VARGDARGNLGLAYKELPRDPPRHPVHEQALLIIREIGARGVEGSALLNMSLALNRQGPVR
jgi:hypothetical protein